MGDDNGSWAGYAQAGERGDLVDVLDAGRGLDLQGDDDVVVVDAGVPL